MYLLITDLLNVPVLIRHNWNVLKSLPSSTLTLDCYCKIKLSGVIWNIVEHIGG